MAHINLIICKKKYFYPLFTTLLSFNWKKKRITCNLFSKGKKSLSSMLKVTVKLEAMKGTISKYCKSK